MDILIFADSHGRGYRMEEVIRRQPKVPDALFFLGDGLREWEILDKGGAESYEVAGNCDDARFADTGVPYERLVELEGFRICLMHGHRCGVKSSHALAAAYADSQKADILLYGHTHEPTDFLIPAGTLFSGAGKSIEKTLHVFNPGSIGEDPSGSGSFGVLTIRHGVCLFSHGKY